jgi:hypothetical protein
MAAGSLGFAYPPAMLHHMDMERVDILRWNQVLQKLMRLLGGDLGVD